MPIYEYKVVPAPKRGLKAKGLKTGEARFANALQQVMNDLGAQGWEYQRTDTLPLEERQGLTGKTTSFQNMLVFRRAALVTEDAPAALIEDQSEAPVAIATPEQAPEQPAPQDIATSDAQDAAAITADDFIGNEEPAAKGADARVNDTLASGFAFPWSSRKTTASVAAKRDGDDPQVAAE